MVTKASKSAAKPSKSLAPPRAGAQSTKERQLGAQEVASKFAVINSIENTFTEENFKKFVLGDATLAQLMGITADQAYAFAEYAYTLYEEGRIREARQIFEALVIQNPKDGYMHFMLGCIYNKLEMPEEAVEEFGYAIDLDNTNIAAHTNRGEILLQHGEFDAALDDLQAAINLDHKGDDPFAMRARALAHATSEVIKSILGKKKK